MHAELNQTDLSHQLSFYNYSVFVCKLFISDYWARRQTEFIR